MRHLALLLLASAAAACTTAPPQQRSAQAEADLQTLLAGSTAGPAMSCLPHSRAGRMVAIDDNIVAFRDGSRLYVNRLQGGGCSHLGSGAYTLLTRTSGALGLCRGDIVEVADVRSGISVGNCILGDFVPYTRPGRG